tara:strand:- start:2732 stop:3010 length:279 start_codon:yes stop_codon:yes gene_type:complete
LAGGAQQAWRRDKRWQTKQGRWNDGGPVARKKAAQIRESAHTKVFDLKERLTEKKARWRFDSVVTTPPIDGQAAESRFKRDREANPFEPIRL